MRQQAVYRQPALAVRADHRVHRGERVAAGEHRNAVLHLFAAGVAGDGADAFGGVFGRGGGALLDHEMGREARLGQEAAPCPGDPCARFQPLQQAVLAGDHAAERLDVGRQRLALHALRLQGRIEGEARLGEALARHAGHRREECGRLGEAETRAGARFGPRQQLEACRRLDAERAVVAGEEAGQVGPVVAEEGRRFAPGGGPGAQHFAARQHDLEADHGVGRGAVPAAAPEHRVLRKPAAHRGGDAGQRSPERRAQALRFQSLVELLPSAAGLHGDVHVLVVYLDHVVHGRHVEAQRPAVRAHVAAAVGQAAATRHDDEVVRAREAHGRHQIVDAAGPDHGSEGAGIAGHVLAVQRQRRGVAEHAGVADAMAQRAERIRSWRLGVCQKKARFDKLLLMI